VEGRDLMEEKEDLIEIEAGIVGVAVAVGSRLIFGMRWVWEFMWVGT